jgi:hypothetical protein
MGTEHHAEPLREQIARALSQPYAGASFFLGSRNIALAYADRILALFHAIELGLAEPDTLTTEARCMLPSGLERYGPCILNEGHGGPGAFQHDETGRIMQAYHKASVYAGRQNPFHSAPILLETSAREAMEITYRMVAPYIGHMKNCTYSENGTGDESDFCSCGLGEMKERLRRLHAEQPAASPAAPAVLHVPYAMAVPGVPVERPGGSSNRCPQCRRPFAPHTASVQGREVLEARLRCPEGHTWTVPMPEPARGQELGKGPYERT